MLILFLLQRFMTLYQWGVCNALIILQDEVCGDECVLFSSCSWTYSRVRLTRSCDLVDFYYIFHSVSVIVRITDVPVFLPGLGIWSLLFLVFVSHSFSHGTMKCVCVSVWVSVWVCECVSVWVCECVSVWVCVCECVMLHSNVIQRRVPAVFVWILAKPHLFDECTDDVCFLLFKKLILGLLQLVCRAAARGGGGEGCVCWVMGFGWGRMCWVGWGLWMIDTGVRIWGFLCVQTAGDVTAAARRSHRPRRLPTPLWRSSAAERRRNTEYLYIFILWISTSRLSWVNGSQLQSRPHPELIHQAFYFLCIISSVNLPGLF